MVKIGLLDMVKIVKGKSISPIKWFHDSDENFIVSLVKKSMNNANSKNFGLRLMRFPKLYLKSKIEAIPPAEK